MEIRLSEEARALVLARGGVMALDFIGDYIRRVTGE